MNLQGIFGIPQKTDEFLHGRMRTGMLLPYDADGCGGDIGKRKTNDIGVPLQVFFRKKADGSILLNELQDGDDLAGVKDDIGSLSVAFKITL